MRNAAPRAAEGQIAKPAAPAQWGRCGGRSPESFPLWPLGGLPRGGVGCTPLPPVSCGMVEDTLLPEAAKRLLDLAEQQPADFRRPLIDALASLANPDCIATLFDLLMLPSSARHEAAPLFAAVLTHDWTPAEIAALAAVLQPRLARF